MRTNVLHGCAPWLTLDAVNPKTYRKKYSYDSGDSKAQIMKCLSCPYRKCINCAGAARPQAKEDRTRYRRLSRAEVEQILLLLHDGWSVLDVADKMKISTSKLYNLIKEERENERNSRNKTK